MRGLIAALAASLVLAGCQTTMTQIDDTIQKNLPAACELIATAHAGFVTINAAHHLSASVVKKEAAAFAGVASICVDPTHVTTSSALIIAANAYAAIVAALHEARSAGT